MKKIAALMIALLMIFASCSPADSDGVIEITERFFVNQTMEVISNPDQYMGRTIRLEGMFWNITCVVTGEQLYFVVRNTDGCCGPIEPIGFELRIDGFDPPPHDAWVEVEGILERYTGIWNQNILRLEVVALTAMSERGAEFVTQ